MFHVSVDSLSVENFGPFYGQHNLDFKVTSDREPFVLIGGKNGAGKTHLLRALYLAVVGDSGVGDLKKVEAGSDATRFNFERSLNRRAEREGQDTAKLTIVLRQRDLNGGSERTLTLIREIRHRPNSKPVWASRAVRSNGPEEVDENTISKWRDAFLPRDLARFFFFDAERGQNVHLGEKEIVDGVSKILGLSAYEELEQDLRQLIANYIPKQFDLSPSSDAASKVGEYSGKIIDVEAQIRGSRNKIETTKLEKSEAQSELTEVEEKLRSFGTVDPEQLQKDQTKRDGIASTKGGIESKLETAWEMALPVALLGEKRQELNQQLLNEDRRRSWEDRKASVEPKIPAIKARVFEDVPKEFELVGNARAFYAGRLDEALKSLFHPPPEGVDKVTIFAADRNETSMVIRQKLAASASGLAELVELNNRLEHLEADLRDLDYQIRQQTQDAAALGAGHELHTRRGELLAKIANFDKQVAEYESTIARLEAQLVEYRGEEKKWREAEKKASQGRSVLVRAHAYREAAAEVRRRAAERMRKKIGEYVGELWTDITERSREFKGLEFDSVWQCKLVRTDGRRVPWDEVNASAGQRQVRLLAFNEALRRLAQLAPPLVIDTPLGRLDKEVRSAVLERLYLQGHQSIILSTNSEIDPEGPLFGHLRDRFGKAFTLEPCGKPDSNDYEVEVIENKYFGKRV